MVGRQSRVVGCVSRNDASGNWKWVATLECGRVVEKVKQARNSRKQHPAPTRVLCKCPKCMRGEGK